MTVPVGREVRLATVARPIPWVYASFFYSFHQSTMGKKDDKIEKKESIAERRRQSYVHQRKDFAARAGKLILANEVKIQVLLLALAIQDR